MPSTNLLRSVDDLQPVDGKIKIGRNRAGKGESRAGHLDAELAELRAQFEKVGAEKRLLVELNRELKEQNQGFQNQLTKHAARHTA